MDRREMAVIGVNALAGGFDAWTSSGAISRGCEEIGSLGLLPKHPTGLQFGLYQVLMQLPYVVAAERTPLAYSSALHMTPFAIVDGHGSIKAGLHAQGCHR